MIVDLILTVCAVTAPTDCREERLRYEARSSLAQCMMLSTPYVAAWAGDHPNLKVKSWRCAWPDGSDRKA